MTRNAKRLEAPKALRCLFWDAIMRTMPLAVVAMITVAFVFAEPLRGEGPTPEQFADLKLAIEEPGTAADDRIRRAMERPENDAYAAELVSAARALYKAGDDSNGLRNLLYFLSCRSGRKEKLLIDGPYLQDYASLLLEMVEQELASKKGWGLQTEIGPVLLYISAHPEDKDVYDRTLKLATKYAQVAKLPPRPDREVPGGSWEHRAWNQARFAWVVLFRLKVLDDGMGFANAKEILGAPTGTSTNNGVTHYWAVPTGFRLYTGMQAVERDGKLEFHFSGRK